MAGPPKKKQAHEQKNDEQSAFQSASNSQYSTMVPMIDAAYVRFHHPHKMTDIHCATDSPLFLATFKEFCEKGLRKKMVSELEYFAENYDEKWRQVLDRAVEHVGPEPEINA